MMKLLHGEKKAEKPAAAVAAATAAKEDGKKGKSGQKQKQTFPRPKPTADASEISAKDLEPANDEVDMLDSLVCKLNLARLGATPFSRLQLS